MTTGTVTLTPAELAEIVRAAAREGARAGVEAAFAASREPKEWLSVREAAERVSASTRTIRRWMKAGLPYAQGEGSGAVRIRPGDLRGWMTDRKGREL